MDLPKILPCHAAHEGDQVVDCDQTVGSQIERLDIPRVHDAEDPFDAVLDVAIGSGLVPVPPHFNRRTVRGLGDLPTDRGRRLLSAPLVGAHRSVHVVEADDSDIEPMVRRKIRSQLFRE